MDSKHEHEKTNETPKVLTVEDLAEVVGGRTLSASESKGPLGIGECRYVVNPVVGGGALGDLSTLSSL
jgi:hypothetical protein